MIAELLCSDKGVSSFGGHVAERFERSAYIAIQDKLYCVALHSIGAGPITFLLSDSVQTLPAEFEKGQDFRLSLDALEFDKGVRISLRNAGIYNSNAFVPLSREWPVHSWSDAFANLDCIPEDGLSAVRIANWQTSYECNPLLSYVENDIENLSHLIHVGLIEMGSQLASGNSHQQHIAEKLNTVVSDYGISKLIGAGPGLTPSGDDFICGVFHALHVRELGAIALGIFACIRGEIIVRTNAVSATFIEHAAHGRVDQTTRNLIMAMSRTDSVRTHSVDTAIVNKLGKMGHTSGWDWLSGFLFCLRSLQNERRAQQGHPS